VLREKLADAGLFTRNPAGFERAAAELETASAKLARAEEEWLAIELLREEIES
jgi:ATP-binding cassette subfamily F protein uup